MSKNNNIQLIELILSHYSLGELTNFEQLYSGYINLSYKIETNINNGKYFLRQYSNSNEENIVFQHSILKHLKIKEFDLVPELIQTKAGNTLAKQITSNGDTKIFAIFEYLRGEDRYSWVNPKCSDEELKNSAVTLAQYHNAVHDLVPNGQGPESPIIELLPRIYESLPSFVENVGATIFDEYFLENLHPLLDSIQQRANAIDEEGVEELLQIVIHGDFHPGNLKFQNEEVTGLFDFDWAKVGLRCFDVGLAIMYFCTAWDGDSDGDLDLSKTAMFLKAYQNTLEDLCGLEPMNEDELAYLADMISASNIYILYWTISHFYTKDVDPAEYLFYLKHGIRGINWFRKKGNWDKLKNIIKNSG